MGGGGYRVGARGKQEDLLLAYGYPWFSDDTVDTRELV